VWRRHWIDFDRAQLGDVSTVYRATANLSDAGRILFDRSRERKKIANDADQWRKYLARSISNGAS
jgi:transcriptional regulatory protein RtcR